MFDQNSPRRASMLRRHRTTLSRTSLRKIAPAFPRRSHWECRGCVSTATTHRRLFMHVEVTSHSVLCFPGQGRCLHRRTTIEVLKPGRESRSPIAERWQPTKVEPAKAGGYRDVADVANRHDESIRFRRRILTRRRQCISWILFAQLDKRPGPRWTLNGVDMWSIFNAVSHRWTNTLYGRYRTLDLGAPFWSACSFSTSRAFRVLPRQPTTRS